MVAWSGVDGAGYDEVVAVGDGRVKWLRVILVVE